MAFILFNLLEAANGGRALGELGPVGIQPGAANTAWAKLNTQKTPIYAHFTLKTFSFNFTFCFTQYKKGEETFY